MMNLESIYKLKINVLFKKSKKVCLIDEKKVYEILNANDEIFSLIKHLIKGVDIHFINDYIKTNKKIFTLYNWLISKKWIVIEKDNPYLGTLNEKNYEYLKVINKTPISILTKISNAHIAIVGCGGIGAVVAQNLVGMGFQKFSLIDFDMIEYSNLNRQIMYNYDDVGKNKPDVLAEKLKRLNPNLKIMIHIKKIQTSCDFNNIFNKELPDFLICGIDNPPILSKLNVAQFCLFTKIPCIFGSVGIVSGNYGPLIDQKEYILSFIEFLNKIKNEYILENIKTIKGSLCATNSIIASFMALDVFKWFSKVEALSFKKILNVDFTNGSIKCVHDF